MKMEFPNQIIQLENSKEIFTSRMSHAEDQISGLKDKVEALDQISNGKKIEEISIQEMWDTTENPNFMS